MRARICRGSVSRKPEDLPIMVLSLPCSKPDTRCRCNFINTRRQISEHELCRAVITIAGYT